MVTRRGAFLALLGLLAVFVAACGGGEPASEAAPLSEELREMIEEVAAVRGLEAPTNLRVQTVAPEDVVEVYTGLIDEESREALQEGGALYQLLGYIEPGETYWDVMVSTAGLAAGFYSYEHKTLWVVTEQDDVDLEALSKTELGTLAHEMAHAIQDHHFDLGETEGRVGATIDTRLAWTSLIEGDATLHTAIWGERRTLIPGGFSVGSLALLADLRQAADMPPAIQRAFWFPYLTGPVAVQRILERRGAEALNALFERSPPGTAAYIHTHLLGSDWSPEEGVDRLLPAEAIVASLGSGWTEEESGVLGEFHLMNYLLGDAAGYPWPAYGYEGRYYSEVEFRVERAGEGWRGDSYRLFKNGEKRALVIVVRFTDAEDAREFEEAHREALAGGEMVEDSTYTLVTRDDGYVVAMLEPVGRDVIFAIGTNAEVARAAVEPLVGS